MLDKQPIRPICNECHKLPARPNGISSKGFQRWHKLCNVCAKKKYVKPKEKDIRCSVCGFVAEHPCQLDIVGDRTVCACCHRLEVHIENEQKRMERELTVDATIGLDDYTL
jgi:ribosomal protein L37E